MHCLYPNAVVQPSAQHCPSYMAWKTKVHSWCRPCYLCINAPMWREKRWLQGLFDTPSYVANLNICLSFCFVLVFTTVFKSNPKRRNISFHTLSVTWKNKNKKTKQKQTKNSFQHFWQNNDNDTFNLLFRFDIAYFAWSKTDYIKEHRNKEQSKRIL